jgi:circadian clock protein KaiC
VMKKRGGAHERTIRELTLSAAKGLNVGPPLRGYRGVLTGLPTTATSNADQDSLLKFARPRAVCLVP